MNSITVKCPAKVNLSLDVVGKRQDGYHFVRMIMQSIALYDQITVEETSSGIGISCNKPYIPTDETNLAYKAAKLIIDRYGIQTGVSIHIDKKIPAAAGLAGGSTDAAGVIYALNKIYKLDMTVEQMREEGLKIGADVPFCICGGTALAEGIGEIISPLAPIRELWCVVAKPPVDVSTRQVYNLLKQDEIPRHPDTTKLIEYIKRDDMKSLALNMTNVLETVTTKLYPVIFEIKNIMMEFDALGSIMSGSGPSVFGLFDDKYIAEKCYNRLRDYLKDVYIVRTCNEGVSVNG